MRRTIGEVKVNDRLGGGSNTVNAVAERELAEDRLELLRRDERRMKVLRGPMAEKASAFLTMTMRMFLDGLE